GEVRAADAARKAQIVFDFGGAARLPTDGPTLDQHGLEPIRRAVDSSAQACRSCAVDREVVFATRGRMKPAQMVRNLPGAGTVETGAVREDADRQTRIVQPLHAAPGAGIFVARELEPIERYAAAL